MASSSFKAGGGGGGGNNAISSLVNSSSSSVLHSPATEPSLPAALPPAPAPANNSYNNSNSNTSTSYGSNFPSGLSSRASLVGGGVVAVVPSSPAVALTSSSSSSAVSSSSSSSSGGGVGVVVAAGSSSNPLATSSSSSAYDWNSEEALVKWRGTFQSALEKVLRHVHPTLIARDDALIYVEDLIIRLLGMLTAKPTPNTIADIEERVSKTFPEPLDKWALTEAKQVVDRGKRKASLVFPVDKIHPMLKEILQNRIDEHVTLYLVAVMEYISGDILNVISCFSTHSVYRDRPLQTHNVPFSEVHFFLSFFLILAFRQIREKPSARLHYVSRYQNCHVR